MLNYRLKISDRARTIRLSVHPDGEVVVTRPRGFRGESPDVFVGKYEKWIQRALEKTKHKKVIYIRRGDIPLLKKRALALAHERIEYFARLYGVTYKKISIRAQKRRWGSCSRNGNISFNYKIAVLPRELVDYIIVHEICHLKQFDHSAKFWELVAATVPDYRALKKNLSQIVFVHT